MPKLISKTHRRVSVQCPGCEKEHTQRNVLCGDCRNTLEWAEGARRREAEKRTAIDAAKAYIYQFGKEYSPFLTYAERLRIYRAIGHAIEALADQRAITHHSGGQRFLPLFSDQQGGLHGGDVVTLTDDQAEAARELEAAVGETLEMLSARALNHGRSLLVQLASGEVTMDDFDSAGIKTKR